MIKSFLIVIALSTSLTLYGQSSTDNWYTIDNDQYHGYLHYTFEEDSQNINASFEGSVKIDSSIIHHNLHIINKKDPFLSVESFIIKRTVHNLPNLETYMLTGKVESDEDFLYWKMEGQKDEIKTKKSTVVSSNLYYIIPTLDYSKKGKIFEFDSMEISELNYKQNHYLEYVGDEIVRINNKDILAKKITHNGERIRESTYWLDSNNNLIKISLDNSKHYVKCKKEDIDFEAYNSP